MIFRVILMFTILVVCTVFTVKGATIHVKRSPQMPGMSGAQGGFNQARQMGTTMGGGFPKQAGQMGGGMAGQMGGGMAGQFGQAAGQVGRTMGNAAGNMGRMAGNMASTFGNMAGQMAKTFGNMAG
ncbi:hypothetical protein R5R35_012184 [Gryllus longicercus]|uniref:Accessory gland protein n=1 Tax=Gryllus longicercus TaxID=2509291 RepID=A0AAN9ZE64_9ORTH